MAKWSYQASELFKAHLWLSDLALDLSKISFKHLSQSEWHFQNRLVTLLIRLDDLVLLLEFHKLLISQECLNNIQIDESSFVRVLRTHTCQITQLSLVKWHIQTILEDILKLKHRHHSCLVDVLVGQQIQELIIHLVS